MVRMLKAHIAMTKSSDVQVRSDLLDFDTSVDPAGRSIIHLVVCWAVCRLMLFGPPFLSTCKQTSYPSKRSLLIRGTALGRADDFGS
jgi:hypothetical protein